MPTDQYSLTAAGKHRQAGKHRHQQANGRGFSSVCSCSPSMCCVLPCIETILPCCRQGHGSEGEGGLGGLGGLGGGSNREETGKMSVQRLFCVQHSSTDMWQLCRSRLLQAGIDKQQSSSKAAATAGADDSKRESGRGLSYVAAPSGLLRSCFKSRATEQRASTAES